MQNGWLFRSPDGGATWTRVKEGLELRNWNIEAGQWYVANDAFTQYDTGSCSVRATVKDLLVHDATYTVRTRILAVSESNPAHWSGMAVGLPTVNTSWSDGILVGMRQNGEVFLWASGATRVSATAAVPNTAAYQTLGVRAEGDNYTLLLNGAELGTWTDPTSGWGDGYVCLATCKARADFDDLAVTGPPDFADNFNVGTWGNGYDLTKVAFSPTEPGVAYVLAGGEGIFRSADHGLSWSRITSSADENLYFYSLLASRHPGGNVYLTKGTFYPSASFLTGVYSQDGTVFDQLGAPSTNYYRSPIAEDALRPNVLYTGEYGPGFLIYLGSVPGTSGVNGPWMFLE